MLKHVRVYALATKFLLRELQCLALNKIQLQIAGPWTTESFCWCIREVYSSSHCRALRSIVVDASFAHLHKLAIGGHFVKFLHEGGDFVCDYLIKMHQHCCIPAI